MLWNRNIRYLGLFLFAALLGSCDNEQRDEPTPPDSLYPVSFQVEGKLTTKGQVTTTVDEILSLGIIGYSTGTSDYNGTTAPNLFKNAHAKRTKDEVSGDLSDWSYDPVAYWPSNPEIKNTFFAYSPHQDQFPEGALEIVADDDDYPQIIYTVPEKMSEQIDLLYSEYNKDVQNIYYSTHGGKVKYNMKHSLLWLRFMIAPMKEITDPEVLATNVNDESYSIYEFNMTAERIINTGIFNPATAKWSPITDENDDGYDPVDFVFDNLDEDHPLTIKAGEMAPMGGTDYMNCLMIIPQAFVWKDNNTTVMVAFTHDDGSSTPSNTDHYITMPFPDVKLDKPGYVMTFIVKLSISGAYIDFVSSNPIDEWLEDETLREIEVY